MTDHLLENFRFYAADHPLVVLIVAAIAVRPILNWLQRGPSIRPSLTRVLLIFTGLAVITWYVATVLWYATTDWYFDHAEPTVTAVAWLVRNGRPMYHAVDSPERYSHIYGPMAFLTHAAAMNYFGASIVVSKAVGAVAALFALGLTFLALRKAAVFSGALVLTAVCSLIYLGFRNVTFWTRPEPLMLLGLVGGLLGAQSHRPLLAAVVVGFTAGLVVNLKVTGPLYFLPIAALTFVRHGPGVLAAATAVGCAVMVLPFALWDNISLRNYLLWIQESSENGLRLRALRQNIEWAVFFMLPVIWATVCSSNRRSSLISAALGLGICGVALTAAKPGAGVYHLVLFVPFICWWTASAATARPSEEPQKRDFEVMATAYLITILLIAAAQQSYFLQRMHRLPEMDVAADIRDFELAHRHDTVAIGYSGMSSYSGPSRLAFYRVIPVFDRGEYLLDAPAIQEHQLSGIGIPHATVAAIRSCRVRWWLIPKGGEPFDARNMYPQTGYARLFGPEFLEAFRQSYRQVGQTRYFEVWGCRASVSP